MINSTESRDILKKDNENFFDIDFKQDKVNSSERKEDADFFDFSMKSGNKVLEEEKETLDFEAAEDVAPVVDAVETSEEIEEIEEVVAETTEESGESEKTEETAEPQDDVVIIENSDSSSTDEVPDNDAIAEVQEETQSTIDAEASTDVPAEIPTEFSNVPAENAENSVEISPEVTKKVAEEVAEKISTEAPESDDVIVNVVKWGKAAKESEVKTVSPKKSNLVIEIDDDFEIKMCNFRDLAKKENNSDKDIKKN